MHLSPSTPKRSVQRRGFGALAVIMLLAVTSVVAMIALPAVTLGARVQRMQETAEILSDVQLSLFNPSNTPPAFRQTIQQNAGRLTQLNTPITRSDPNSCPGQFFGTPQVKNWVSPMG